MVSGPPLIEGIIQAQPFCDRLPARGLGARQPVQATCLGFQSFGNVGDLSPVLKSSAPAPQSTARNTSQTRYLTRWSAVGIPKGNVGIRGRSQCTPLDRPVCQMTTRRPMGARTPDQ